MSSSSLSGGQVTLGIVGDASNFASGVASEVEGASGRFAGLGKKLGGLILSGFAAIGIGTAIGDYVKSGIEEYQAFDAMNANFASALTKGGKAAGVTKKSMDDLAISVASYSGQAVTSIGKTEQILLGFHNIKNTKTDKVFDEATKAAANLAQTMGGSASSQASRLGRALSDPVKGMTALRRVGVTFTASQQDAIKTMVAHNNVLGAQKLILAQVNSVTGDSAKQFGNTLPGAIARSKVAIGEMNRTLVTAFLPVLTPLINGMANKINDVAIPAIEKLTDKIAKDAVPMFKSWAKGVENVMAVFGGKQLDIGSWTTPVKMLGDAFRLVFDGIKGHTGTVLRELGGALGKLGTDLAPVVTAVLKFVAATSPLGAVLKGIGPLLPQLIKLFGDLAAQLSGSLVKTLTALMPSLSRLAQVITGLVSSALRTALPLITELAKELASLLQHNQGAITTFAVTLVNAASAVLTFLKPLLTSKPVLQSVIAAFLVWKGINLIDGIAKTAGAIGQQVFALVRLRGGLLDTIRLQAMYAKDAVVNAVKAAAAWVASAAKQSAAFVGNAAFAVRYYATLAAQAVASAAKSAAAWVASATEPVRTWLVGMARVAAAWVAQTAVAVAQGAKQAAVWLAQKAAVLAQVAVMAVLKGAQVAATAAQWLFNAAMSANPITLVIIAIAALVAGLIWFFTQTKLGKAIWQDIVNFLVNAWQFLVTVAQAAWQGIVIEVTTVINTVKAIINTVVGWITAYWNAEVNLWHTVITTVFNAIKAVVTNVINTVKAIINTVVGWITGYIRMEVNAWHTVITTVFNAIKAVVSSVIGTVKSVISGAVSFLSGLWRSTWSNILAILKTTWSNILSAVQTAIGRVIGFVKDLGSKIISTIQGFVGGMVTAAGNLIQGLIQGIQNGGSAVITAMLNVAKGALNAVKSFFGIKSPSTVFRQIGLYLGQGLKHGIDGSADQVKSAMTTLSDKVVTTFDSLVKQRTAAQKKLATLDREYGNVTGLKAAAVKRRALLESEIADEKRTVAELTKESSKSTESSILSLIKRDNKTLAGEAKRRDGIAAQLKDATTKAADALKTQTDFASSVKDNALGQGSVIGVTGSQNADGSTNAATSNDIIAKLKKAVSDTKVFAADLKQLRKMGLDDVTYKQLVDAGVGGGGLDAAVQLLSGGQQAVSQVASLQSQLSASATTLGDTTAKSLYGAATASADGIVNGLKHSDKKVTNQMETLGANMVKALKKKLDIKSPSRVAHEIGGYFGDGLANGLVASTPKVTKSTVDLFKVPTTTATRFGVTVGKSDGSAPTIVNQFNGQMGYTRDEVADAIVTRQRRAQQKVKVPRT